MVVPRGSGLRKRCSSSSSVDENGFSTRTSPRRSRSRSRRDSANSAPKPKATRKRSQKRSDGEHSTSTDSSQNSKKDVSTTSRDSPSSPSGPSHSAKSGYPDTSKAASQSPTYSSVSSNNSVSPSRSKEPVSPTVSNEVSNNLENPDPPPIEKLSISDSDREALKTLLTEFASSSSDSDDMPASTALAVEKPKRLDQKIVEQLGDKLTVKFKISLPPLINGLFEGPTHILRMPTFMPVERAAFDVSTFKDQMTPDDLKDQQKSSEYLNRLKATVRWRLNKETGEKESNSRLVRWSDGSETFHVGGEVFDVMHHPVTDDQNRFYMRQKSCYQAQGVITDKMTLRPKLDSMFGQSHVQGMRNRAMNRPQTGYVKVHMDMSVNPGKDRERRVKEEIAQLRREDREKRRDLHPNRKSHAKLIHHCTADDSDEDALSGKEAEAEDDNSVSVLEIKKGIRTNRNGGPKPPEFEYEYESDDGDDKQDDDDINDPKPSTSKQRQKTPSDSENEDDGPKIAASKRKLKQLVYSDSDSD